MHACRSHFASAPVAHLSAPLTLRQSRRARRGPGCQVGPRRALLCARAPRPRRPPPSITARSRSRPPPPPPPHGHDVGGCQKTAGDLIFAGGTNDRNFRAFDAKTGELLWQQKTNSGIVGMPVAYEVDGTEYIAIQSGWGVDAQRIQDALTTNNIGLENNVPQGGVLWVFAVKK